MEDHTEIGKVDGSGYPRGLEGEEIPLEGRIAAVADVYDALTRDRPYREGMPAAEATDLMAEGPGSHFDPEVLDAFMAAVLARAFTTRRFSVAQPQRILHGC